MKLVYRIKPRYNAHLDEKTMGGYRLQWEEQK